MKIQDLILYFLDHDVDWQQTQLLVTPFPPQEVEFEMLSSSAYQQKIQAAGYLASWKTYLGYGPDTAEYKLFYIEQALSKLSNFTFLPNFKMPPIKQAASTFKELYEQYLDKKEQIKEMDFKHAARLERLLHVIQDFYQNYFQKNPEYRPYYDPIRLAIHRLSQHSMKVYQASQVEAVQLSLYPVLKMGEAMIRQKTFNIVLRYRPHLNFTTGSYVLQADPNLAVLGSGYRAHAYEGSFLDYTDGGFIKEEKLHVWDHYFLFDLMRPDLRKDQDPFYQQSILRASFQLGIELARLEGFDYLKVKIEDSLLLFARAMGLTRLMDIMFQGGVRLGYLEQSSDPLSIQGMTSLGKTPTWEGCWQMAQEKSEELLVEEKLLLAFSSSQISSEYGLSRDFMIPVTDEALCQMKVLDWHRATETYTNWLDIIRAQPLITEPKVAYLPDFFGVVSPRSLPKPVPPVQFSPDLVVALPDNSSIANIQLDVSQRPELHHV